MGKASRVKRENARERIAAQRAAARRAEIRNRMFITGGTALGVIAIVVAFVLVKTLGHSTAASAGSTGATGAALPASVIKDVTSVPAATLNAVGAGTGYAKSVSPVSAPPLTSGGKPEIVYIGAEYCPYCATERWALAVALSRFGTFSGLTGIHSAGSPELYPATATLSFYKSSYTSPYLAFSPVEEQTVSKATLQVPTSQQQALVTKYDNPPYVSANSADAIPFIDFGGKYLVHGAQFNPQLLQGQTWSQVAAALQDKSSAIGQGADGAANMITAAICKMTNNQPSSVCTSPAVKTVQGQL